MVDPDPGPAAEALTKTEEELREPGDRGEIGTQPRQDAGVLGPERAELPRALPRVAERAVDAALARFHTPTVAAAAAVGIGPDPASGSVVSTPRAAPRIRRRTDAVAAAAEHDSSR